MTSSIPAALRRRSVRSKNGMFMTGTMGLGVSSVSGRSRVPSPPTRTTACTRSFCIGLGRGNACWKIVVRRVTTCWHSERVSLPYMRVRYDQGNGFVECQDRFRFSHTAWVKAIRNGRLRATPTTFVDRRRKYDWSEVQRYHDEGHTYRQCAAKFGFHSMAWFKARRRGELKTRPLATPI